MYRARASRAFEPLDFGSIGFAAAKGTRASVNSSTLLSANPCLSAMFCATRSASGLNRLPKYAGSFLAMYSSASDASVMFVPRERLDGARRANHVREQHLPRSTLLQ